MLKVGDIVKQGNRLIEFRGNRKPARSKVLGTVVAIHESTFPNEWEETEHNRQWAKILGRRIDVMWSSGRLSENFAENSLEVVSEI